MQRARSARFVPALVAGLVTSVAVAAIAVAGGSSSQVAAAGAPPAPTGQAAGQLVIDGKTIPILSYSAGVSNSGTISGGSGGGAGRASFSSLGLIKNVDANSPGLFTAVASGEHFPTAVFTAQWGTGPSSASMTFELEDVLVVSAQQSGGGAAPSESIALDFGKVRWTYTDASGSTSGSWNVAQNAP
jgi:type VI secretion system secreted protein Hcp